MKVTFIATVYNEEKSIEEFLQSLFDQTQMPQEIVIVDGKSTDKTVSRMRQYVLRNKKDMVKTRILIKKGNRSVGRNEAIRQSTGQIIACSDAGCLLERNWLKNIIKPLNNKRVDVVAGYYKGRTMNIWQKCVVSYILVMPDKTDSDTFLPATRSMAFRKNVWEEVGRFPEQFSHNEDYVFAKRLQAAKKQIVFMKQAIVYWSPPTGTRQIFTMFYRFALGDAEALIIRPKVVVLFVRYMIAVLLFILFIALKSFIIAEIIGLGVCGYMIWAICKNYKYIGQWQAFVYLPILQLISDCAVLLGTMRGLLFK